MLLRCESYFIAKPWTTAWWQLGLVESDTDQFKSKIHQSKFYLLIK